MELRSVVLPILMMIFFFGFYGGVIAAIVKVFQMKRELSEVRAILLEMQRNARSLEGGGGPTCAEACPEIGTPGNKTT